MSRLNLRATAVFAVASALLGAHAQGALGHARGHIVSTNWTKMEIELKDEKGRVTTWQVARDCVVKFSDQADKFPNPSLKDLKAPMYIHFMMEGPVIQNIDVKEVGFDADKGGAGVEEKAVVSNLDMNVGHVEVVLSPGGKKTFEVDPKSVLTGINKGDSVTLLIEKREGKEVVTKITKTVTK